MAQLYPYLHLDGTTREALNFYKDILGAEVELMTVEQSGMADQMPPDMPKVDPNKIMHASLKKNGKTLLMAADMMDPSSFTKGDNVSVCIVCDSKEEIETVYKKLSEGGSVFMELKEEFFGWFASFTDKFGVDWMLQYGSRKEGE